MAIRRPPAAEDRAVGQRLRELRKERGKSAWEMAVALKMSQQNYEAYEAGRNDLKARKVVEFAEALGMKPQELLRELYEAESNSFRSKQPADSVGARLLAGTAA